MNLLPVCKLYPTLLARLLMQDKKSMQLNLNVSSQSNHSTVGLLQAKLWPCYGSGKPEFKAGKHFKHCGNIKLLTPFSLEMFSTSDVTSSVTYFSVRRQR